jgi:uncharacterized membrane protein
MFYLIETTIPISYGQSKTREKSLGQSNFETILQVISLRSQPQGITEIVKEGTRYKFKFFVESEDVFGENDEKLKDDFMDVPVIDGLYSLCFLSTKQNPNLWISRHHETT